jgi:hypothetical protein
MPILTKRQEDILWAIAKQYDFHPLKLKNKDFRADIDFLIKNKFIEIYVNVFRLLPDGVICLFIETEFFDISTWTRLIEKRIKTENKTIYSSFYESEEYIRICNKIVHIKKQRELDEYKVSKNISGPIIMEL